MNAASDTSPATLNRCLGPVAVTAQAVATVGLTLTAVINIPAAARSAGHATWICYAIAQPQTRSPNTLKRDSAWTASHS